MGHGGVSEEEEGETFICTFLTVRRAPRASLTMVSRTRLWKSCSLTDTSSVSILRKHNRESFRLGSAGRVKRTMQPHCRASSWLRRKPRTCRWPDKLQGGCGSPTEPRCWCFQSQREVGTREGKGRCVGGANVIADGDSAAVLFCDFDAMTVCFVHAKRKKTTTTQQNEIQLFKREWEGVETYSIQYITKN